MTIGDDAEGEAQERKLVGLASIVFVLMDRDHSGAIDLVNKTSWKSNILISITHLT